jgi:hypothetical protein
MKTAFGKYIRKQREALREKDKRFSLRQGAHVQKVGIKYQPQELV